MFNKCPNNTLKRLVHLKLSIMVISVLIVFNNYFIFIRQYELIPRPAFDCTFYNDLLKQNTSNNMKDGLSQFSIIHENILRGSQPLKISINGYTDGGYANKLYSMLSSLVIALITDSAFVIKWNEVVDHVNEPFYNTFSQIENTPFDINNRTMNSFIHPRGKSAWTITKNMNKLIQTRLPFEYDKYLYNCIEPYFYELCSNPIYYETFYKNGLVKRETLLDAYEIISNMDQTTDQNKQHYILKIPFEVGGNLLNKIWIPKNHIMNRVNHIVNNLFKNYYMIGLQLRYFYIDDPLDTYKFIDCAFEIEKNITKMDPKFKIKYKGFKWFLTSDSSDVIYRLTKEYSNKIVVGEGKVGHIVNSTDSYPRTIMDVELLSRCNDLVITGGSTFGFISSMKMLKLPYFVVKGKYFNKCIRSGLHKPPFDANFNSVF
jgi:hypothetical protein